MLQLRPGGESGLQVLPCPGLGAHEAGVGFPLGSYDRLQGVQPCPVQILRPGVQPKSSDLILDLGQLLVEILVPGLAHFIKDGVRFT
jgi:hypothetical protein